MGSGFTTVTKRRMKAPPTPESEPISSLSPRELISTTKAGNKWWNTIKIDSFYEPWRLDAEAKKKKLNLFGVKLSLRVLTEVKKILLIQLFSAAMNELSVTSSEAPFSILQKNPSFHLISKSHQRGWIYVCSSGFKADKVHCIAEHCISMCLSSRLKTQTHVSKRFV